MIEMVDGRLTIGRAEDNDLCLAGGAFPSVSTYHARLEQGEEGLEVLDLDSRNGTFVNDEKVDKMVLKAGDVLQLGPVGPRFIVVSSAPLSETMFVDPSQVRGKSDLSADQVRAMVERRQRKLLMVLGLAVATLVITGLLEKSKMTERGDAQQAELQAELEEARGLINDLRNLDARRQQELDAVRNEREAYVMGLEAEIDRAENESNQLADRLERLESGGASADEIRRLETELDRTRTSLEDAKQAFARFDPVNLEAARLGDVGRVREAVVLLEVRTTVVERETGKVLHLSSTGEPNFDSRGQPWSLESTGSGFCVDPEGWILTNAHVVAEDTGGGLYLGEAQGVVEPKSEIFAVFSDTSRRYPAEVVKVASTADLALVKIEPFDFMPYLENFTTESAVPNPGSDVYLFGFPLGNFALQEGERVIASTFRGILSREVGDNLQVDAGVHPGNSGGPITDPTGRVIGVVVSVQSLPDQSAVYTIGYGIPIGAASEVWPPPSDGDETVDLPEDQ